MSGADYKSKLEELNIFINSKNFLVYQGKVEEIALKNPKERMQMFEEISESGQFKGQYEQAMTDQKDAEERSKDAHQNKKVSFTFQRQNCGRLFGRQTRTPIRPRMHTYKATHF